MKLATRLLVADDWSDYALLDSGAGRKLERFGEQTVSRPDPQAFWTPSAPSDSWRADAVFDEKTSEDERGAWRLMRAGAPDVWTMRWNELTFQADRPSAIWVFFRSIRCTGALRRSRSARPGGRSRC